MRLGLIGVAGVLTLIWVVAPLVAGTGPAEPMAPGPPGDGSWLPPAAGALTREVSAQSTGSEPSPASSPEGTLQTSEAATTPARGIATTAVEHHAERAAPHVHSEEEPADQPVWSAIPADTPPGVLEALAAAVEARLVAELTGEGREAYPEVVWLDAPCCEWVKVTGLVADVTIPKAVRVIVEWETDQGRGSGPTYWSLDETGGWVAAISVAST